MWFLCREHINHFCCLFSHFPPPYFHVVALRPFIYYKRRILTANHASVTRRGASSDSVSILTTPHTLGSHCLTYAALPISIITLLHQLRNPFFIGSRRAPIYIYTATTPSRRRGLKQRITLVPPIRMRFMGVSSSQLHPNCFTES